MRPSARAQLYADSVELEGNLNHLYFDTVNLATTGIGCMIDAGAQLTDLGRRLPWRTKTSEYASEADADAEYARLKALGIQAQGGRAYAAHAALFLDDTVIDWLFWREVMAMEKAIAGYLPNWSALRADAQLAAILMAYNVGPNMFNPAAKAYWPNLTAALRDQDYVKASDNCMVNAAPSERNRRDRKMFLQAARAELFGADPDQIFGRTVRISAGAVVNGNPTKPGSHAWWAQAVMHVTGHYTLQLDGLFGDRSLAAFKAATGSAAVTRPALQKLADATKSTLGIEVTD
jgi:hypothetical protein